MKNVFQAIIAIVLVVAIVIVGYKISWWVEEDSTNRQTVIDRQSTAFNTSRIEKVRDDIIEISNLADGPQKQNIIRGICEAVADVNQNTVPSDIAVFAAQNC